MKLKPAFFILLLTVGLGCAEAVGQEETNARLGRKIQGIISSKKLQGAILGIKVYSFKTRETVFEQNPGQLFSVASNMKLATTAAALARLGADHRLSATLYRRGKIVSRVLKGDLVIIGRGDPNISGRFHGGDTESVLDTWARTLKAVGVDRVEGSIIADGTAYGTEAVPPGWPRNQLEKWYCAPVSPLSINDNCFDVTISPGAAPKKPAKIVLRPRTGVAKLNNKCTTTSSRKKHRIWISRRPGTNEVTVKGAFWQRSRPQTFNVTIHNPPLVFASALAEALKRQGITPGGTVKVASKPVETKGLVPVAQHSTLLASAIAVANKRSQNLHAEILLRELARKSGSGSRRDGIKSVVDFFASFGVRKSRVSPADGCGLDRSTKLSPSAIVALLAYMRSRPDLRIFKESLAVSGCDGTLKNRFKGKELKGRVHAKTGYVRGAGALSGYAVNEAGEEFAFSIVINNAAKLTNSFMKGVQDEIVTAILENK